MTARKTSLIKQRVDRFAEELDKCRLELHRAQNALEECLEYFQGRYDGETFSDGTVSRNEEMKLGQMVEEALGRGGRYGL